jgi:hypothetical protein
MEYERSLDFLESHLAVLVVYCVIGGSIYDDTCHSQAVTFITQNNITVIMCWLCSCY